MNGIGSKEIGPQVSIIDDSSDDDETETDDILALLITQLDNLENQQHESITLVHDQLQRQRQAVDALRKSVREAESVIHQKRFSRQRAKIRRLKELKAAGTPVYRSATPGISSEPVLETPKERWTPIAKETKITPATSRLAFGSGMRISRRQTVRFATDIEEPTLVGESPVNNHDDDIVMLGSDGDDVHPELASPTAPVAPPMGITESRRAPKKPAAAEVVAEIVAEEAAEKAAEIEKKRRPVPKMRPTRGRGPRGRGGTLRGITSRKPQGGSIVGSTSSRSGSREPKSVVAPPARGYGTARRAQPFRKGRATARSSSSSAVGSDASGDISMPAAKATPLLRGTSGFVAVNTPTPPIGSGPSNWMDDWQKGDGTPLSSLPAGAGVVRTGSSPLKPLPPPRSKGKAVESLDSPRNSSKRLQAQQDLPSLPALFSSKDLRAIFGGGNPGSIIANVTPDGQQNAVVQYASYICLSPDAHFDPPGTVCDNAAILDVDGQEDPLDSETIYPVWKKIGKAWMYCGDYTQGKREMVSVDTWKSSNEVVKKYWAKKVQETEWGREFLVRKGFRHHGEIKNNSVAEVLGYFSIADDRKGLRLSATTLNFKNFNRSAYDRMVEKAATLNPAGLLLAPMDKLGPNNLSAKPRTSLLAAGGSDSPKATNTPTLLRERKRRRVEASPEEEVEVEIEGGKVETPAMSQRRPTQVGNERGRRTSRNVVNYRIAPLSEFSGEMEKAGGKENEVIELSDADDDDSTAEIQGEKRDEDEDEGEDEGEGEEEEEGEGEEGEGDEGGSGGEMVID